MIEPLREQRVDGLLSVGGVVRRHGEVLGGVQADAGRRAALEKALAYMGLEAGKPIIGQKIDVVFVGSCTNSRMSDLRAAASVLKGRKVSPHVRTMIVPGSQEIKRQAEAEGLDRIFKDAGFEWRGSGCSSCVAMSGDTVPAGERWDLTSLGWYLMSPTGASLTEASTAAAAYTFFQSASYTIKINQTVVRQGPMFPFMGHLQGNTTAVSTVLAMTTERPAESWTDQFGDETPIILAEKVKVYLTVNCSAVAAALNGFLLGYRMGRLRANLSL